MSVRDVIAEEIEPAVGVYAPELADAIIARLEASGRSILHKDEIHAPSIERINAKAEQIMLTVVNEWHRQVGINEIINSKLTKRIADTVATGVFAAALRELMKGVGR